MGKKKGFIDPSRFPDGMLATSRRFAPAAERLDRAGLPTSHRESLVGFTGIRSKTTKPTHVPIPGTHTVPIGQNRRQRLQDDKSPEENACTGKISESGG